jgi:RNA polymerase-binding protein DksA
VNVERFRRMLLEERARVSHALEFLQGEHTSTIEDETGEPRIDQHIADAATATLDREIGESLEVHEGYVLVEIDAALARIDDGSYGTCERCRGPIAEERLEALPHARLCIECKRLEERS